MFWKGKSFSNTQNQSFMENELNALYYEASIIAKWLEGNFKAGTEHKKLTDYLIDNQLELIPFEIHLDINRCMKRLKYSEDFLKYLIEEIKQSFKHQCNRASVKNLHYSVLSDSRGLSLPSAITQFYWDEFGSSNFIQFQGNLSFQTGDIINIEMFPNYLPVNNYYVKEKITQLERDVMIIGYTLAVRGIV
jgi:hypothetical protein